MKIFTWPRERLTKRDTISHIRMNHGESFHNCRVAADINDLLSLANKCAVPMVASVTSVDSLHSYLVPGRGKKKGFDAIVHLKLPGAVSSSNIKATLLLVDL